ncbi:MULTISPECIES: mechanosensitive ion channel family protein [Moorena]|uniref:Small-conductance mechanosensitive channel n=1 Tax=Moorena producens 3L TaxID=489825 RepID=F4XWY3_9CYAN|nr:MULTISPECIES: mechanosensitive ion channel family protein [Moorena]NEQ13952.1 mechanosensitive ion channel [Moorena sp. SIO3E2]EGJ30868.1 small-conductance mechanosensitive channel [Moorena producens 3L]NEP36040.1 mechanosensitive ion channel [Moorena sp. SIO3B2]NEP64832.1 mechanosensitive ion channel [Moorena sp. SIO3A5]NEQ05319.1 mechanosensitive ion channel [Moorena sp. SIO4E2]
MSKVIWQNDWFIWAIALGIGFPLLVIILTEITHRLQRRGQPIAVTLRLVRNRVLPVLVFLLFIQNVVELDLDNNVVKLVETLLWIFVIDASLSLINSVLFEAAGENTWRGRIPKLLLDLSRFFLVALGAAIVLSKVWGADLAGLATALGVGSIVIGLALQDSLGSVFSGVALLFARPFEVGDWLQIGDKVGQVIDMNWRAVHLVTRDGDMIIIPHRVLGGEIVLNYSKPKPIHVETFRIDFDSDDPPNLIKQVLKETALATEGILSDPSPEIRTMEYNDYRGNYEVKFSIEDYKDAPRIREQLMTRIWYAAQRNNLGPTIPIYRLRKLDSDPNQADSTLTKFTESLKSMPVFVPVAKQQKNLENLSKGAVLQHFGVGETVIRQGDPGHALYIIIAGKAVLNLKDSYGEQQEVMTLSSGEFFGEMALFSGKPSSVSVTVVEDLQTIALYSDLVNQMIESTPSLAREIGQIIEARRKAIDEVKQANLASSLASSNGAELSSQG